MERSRKKSKVCLRTKAPKREEKSTISLLKKSGDVETAAFKFL